MTYHRVPRDPKIRHKKNILFCVAIPQREWEWEIIMAQVIWRN